MTATTTKPVSRRPALLIAAALVLAAIAGPAAAMTADEAFTDGNRLFRDDLYWAALLRYRQALEDGLSTPVLHYNTGVAHYRAGQHIRAREALERALGSPQLRVAAQYNLGLNAWALGEEDEALRWFRLARDQQQSATLSEYANVAIARILGRRQASDPIVVHEEEVRRKRDFTNLDFGVTVGFGIDDNVFRTPPDPYIDEADPTLPIVIPESVDGAYVPVDLGLRYKVNSLPFEGFFGAYRLQGRLYQDRELENANEYSHEILFGSEYERSEDERTREVFSAFRIAQHDETWYDPDDGSIRAADGTEFADRMNYLRYGPELRLRQAHRNLAVGLIIKGQLWDYDDVDDVTAFDHEYFLFTGYAQYKLAAESLFRLALSKYSRRFSDRPSHDLDGLQLVGAPAIRYDYLEAELTARQRVFDSLWFEFSYQRTHREDRYQGYNDYERDSYGGEMRWSPGRRFDLAVGGRYRLYNYDNAFAFHNATSGRKSLETGDVWLEATFRMTPHLSLVLDGRRRQVISNDLRLQYERNLVSLGIRWQL